MCSLSIIRVVTIFLFTHVCSGGTDILSGGEENSEEKSGQKRMRHSFSTIRKIELKLKMCIPSTFRLKYAYIYEVENCRPLRVIFPDDVTTIPALTCFRQNLRKGVLILYMFCLQ